MRCRRFIAVKVSERVFRCIIWWSSYVRCSCWGKLFILSWFIITHRSCTLTSIFFQILLYYHCQTLIWIFKRIKTHPFTFFLYTFHTCSHTFFFVDGEYLKLWVLNHCLSHSLSTIVVFLWILKWWWLNLLFSWSWCIIKLHFKIIRSALLRICSCILIRC